jgi:hypothetical protein
MVDGESMECSRVGYTSQVENISVLSKTPRMGTYSMRSTIVLRRVIQRTYCLG